MVRQAVFRGDHLDLLLSAGPGGHPLRARGAPQGALAEGTAVMVELSPGDLRVLDD